MRLRRVVAWAVAIICGAELAVAVVIGGAGLSAILGWEAGLVAAAVGLVAFETYRRRTTPAK